MGGGEGGGGEGGDGDGGDSGGGGGGGGGDGGCESGGGEGLGGGGEGLGGGGLGEGGGGDGEGGGGDGLGYVPATSVLRPSKSTNGLCIHIVMLRIIYISEPGTAPVPAVAWFEYHSALQQTLGGNKEVTDRNNN